jgi:Tfp pilus assembly ATPase PilU
MVSYMDLKVWFFIEQAETTEDLNEWRSALENALAQAPSVVNTAEQLPVVSTDITEPVEAAVEQCKLFLLYQKLHVWFSYSIISHNF